MAHDPERRRHYPDLENVPLSVALREAVTAHDHQAFIEDETALFEQVDMEALDILVTGADGIWRADEVTISLRIRLPNVSLSVWTDGAIDIRVTTNELSPPSDEV